MATTVGFESDAGRGGDVRHHASDYDDLPYVSLPIEYTQPSRIAAIAQLFGVTPPDAERARVLELGCASGGNLIPLAYRFPEAQFLGFDLSRRHVEEGNARIATLRLSNIEIRQGDLAEIDLAGKQFDYIICHGVFSWVPAAVQAAILRLCKRHLVANGIATISYNVLPGWHLRRVIRDMCLLHAGTGDARDRVARARAIIERIAAGGASTTYAGVVAAEAKSLARKPSSYIMGEFLAESNEPCYFSAFAARSEQQGLHWLCEAELVSTMPDGMAPKSAQTITELAGGDPVRMQSYLDTFTGRTHRRSLVVHAAAHAVSRPVPAADRMAGLHLSGRFIQQDGQSATDQFHFKDAAGRNIRARSQAIADILRDMGARFPSTVELTKAQVGSAQAMARLHADLLRLAIAGRLTLSTMPLHVGRAGQERPVVWPLARLEAGQRQPWVTSLRHAPVILNERLRSLVQLMDGSITEGQLASHLAEMMRREPAETETDRQVAIEHAIKYLSDQGLILSP